MRLCYSLRVRTQYFMYIPGEGRLSWFGEALSAINGVVAVAEKCPRPLNATRSRPGTANKSPWSVTKAQIPFSDFAL
jgi:hypothetical protein